MQIVICVFLIRGWFVKYINVEAMKIVMKLDMSVGDNLLCEWLLANADELGEL